MSKEILTRIEESILCGSTWATSSMTFGQRLRFWRNTGEWPGVYLKTTTEMLMQSNIDAERSDGKIYCANRKLERVKDAGLKVK